jgi:outer membrane protein TolC
MRVLRVLLPASLLLAAALCSGCGPSPAAGDRGGRGTRGTAAAQPAPPVQPQAPAAQPAAPAPAIPPIAPTAPTVKPDPSGKSTLGAPAAPAGPTTLSVEESVLVALRNNVDLRRTRLADWQAALDRSSALAQFLPSLGASISRDHDEIEHAPDTTTDTASGSFTARTPIGTTITGRVSQSVGGTSGVSDNARDYSATASAEVRQPLLAGAGTAVGLYEYRAADLGRSASARDLERTAQSTAFQVRRLYWSALQDELSLAANKRSLESADYFLKAAQAREQAGQASKLDVSNAEIQRSSREVALTLAEARREQGLDSLKQALDLPLGERLALSSPAAHAPVTVNMEDIPKLALKRRPDLASARDRLEVMRLDVERKRRNSWPSLDLVAGYTTKGAGSDTDESQTADDHDVRVGLELSVPLGLVAARNARQRSELELRRGELDLHSREVGVMAEVRRVIRDLDASERNVASYEKRLDAAKLAAAAAKALYERGRASSFDVVRAEDDLLAAELGLASSRADYLSRVAELDLVSGRPVNELLPNAKLPDVKSELKRETRPAK